MSSCLSKEFECSICLGILKEPQLLLCGHMFCRDCLTSANAAPEAKNDCALCRKVSDASPAPVSVRNVCQELIKHGECEAHRNMMRHYYCMTCDSAICSDCVLDGHRDSGKHVVRRRDEVVQQMRTSLGQCRIVVDQANADISRQLSVLRGLKWQFREHVDMMVAALDALPEQFDERVDSLTRAQTGEFSALVCRSMSELTRVGHMDTSEGVGATMARMTDCLTRVQRGASSNPDEVTSHHAQALTLSDAPFTPQKR